jgi:predicted outer membrane repeat protein
VTSSFLSNNTGGSSVISSGGGAFLSVTAQAGGVATESFVGDTVSGNSTAGSGGGIFTTIADSSSQQASVSISSTTLSGNSAGSSGGGLFASATNSASGHTNLNLTGDTVSGNTAANGGGGFVTVDSGFFSDGQATASLTNTTFTDNTAHSLFANGLGGGLFTQITTEGIGQAAVNLSGVQVSANATDQNGGGVYAALNSTAVGSATLAVSTSTLAGNNAGLFGGGFYVKEFVSGLSARTSANLTLTGSSVSGNRATTGAGLYLDLSSAGGRGARALASVTASTFEGNTATNQGGGIYAQEQASAGSAPTTATLTLTNSTLFGNTSVSGGGLLNNTLSTAGTVGVTLLSDTVAFNGATSSGGGLDALGDKFTVRSTLIAANTAGSGADALGNFSSAGHNLVGQTDGSSGWVITDLTGTSASPLDARLDGFGNNGGPTKTLALLRDSPAIGQGDPTGPATDQRGVVRNATAPTIGAFEFVQPSSFLVAPAFPNVPAGTGFSITVSALDSAGHLLAGYLGTIHFTSSDGAATLPADFTFTVADGGRHTFVQGVTLQTKGPQTITVTGDGVSGTGTVNVTDPLGTWTPLTHRAPVLISTMLLLTDGTVLAEGLSGAGAFKSWYKLTPDAHGSYVNGTWSQVASMGLERLYFGSNVLPDGRVFLVGGEFTGPSLTNNDTNTGEIYDPLANTWTPISNFPQSHFGDDPTALLPDGRILGGYIGGPQTYIYDPASNSWTFAANKLRNDRSDEETWVTLPDGSVLSYDVFHDGHAQRYIPAQNQWVDAGNVPVILSGSSEELGGAFRLPDGRVLFLGATGHTALYDLTTNSWTAGPDIPAGLVTDDAPGAMMPNGHVLFSADHPGLQGPTTLFEFDPVGNTITPVLNAPSVPGSAFGTRMLMLPSGQVLFTNGGTQLYTYTLHGDPDPAWRPTIAGVADNGDGTFTLTGTQLNGISEGASYGDDAEMSTNYPIIRLVDAAGNVFYARTFNWNIGVATGDTVVSTEFTLPAGLPAGTYSLSVVANGIASTPVDFTVSSGASATGLDGLSPAVWPGRPLLGDGLS